MRSPFGSRCFSGGMQTKKKAAEGGKFVGWCAEHPLVREKQLRVIGDFFFLLLQGRGERYKTTADSVGA